MRILGIDPGTSSMGWGVVESDGRVLSSAGYGLIDASKIEDLAGKIKHISEQVTLLIRDFEPEAVAVEEPFYSKNANVLLRIGQASGAVMAAALLQGRQVAVYSVLEIKQAVVGYGKADKKQVQEMVKILLKMDRMPSPADSADALAAAICHHNIIR